MEEGKTRSKAGSKADRMQHFDRITEATKLLAKTEAEKRHKKTERLRMARLAMAGPPNHEN